MYKARYKKYVLNFKRPAGTSRGVLTQRDTYFIILEKDSTVGIGECSTLEGLSIDHVPGYEKKLREICNHINEYISNPHQKLMEWPSICFGIETALKDIENGGKRELFPSEFTEGKEGIYINGLIWMGSFDFMKEQLDAKLREGYKCIKVKIGGIDFEEEMSLLSQLRKRYSPDDIELRLDANGAFKNEEAMNKLQRLSEFHIHSIEQPIKQGNWEKMAELCKTSPIPIALDEDLVVTHVLTEKEKLVAEVKPHYLILKPSLLGGFESCREWITLAEKYDAKWWVTSALESNIGLNAIAQWAYKASLNPSEGAVLPQGLGTGQLYTHNIASPLVIENSRLWYKGNNNWNVEEILNKN